MLFRSLRTLSEDGDPIEGQEVLTNESRSSEEVYLGLRVADGVEINEATTLRVQPWLQSGWAALDGSRLRLTPQGWLRLDTLAADLTLVASYC